MQRFKYTYTVFDGGTFENDGPDMSADQVKNHLSVVHPDANDIDIYDIENI